MKTLTRGWRSRELPDSGFPAPIRHCRGRPLPQMCPGGPPTHPAGPRLGRGGRGCGPAGLPGRPGRRALREEVKPGGRRALTAGRTSPSLLGAPRAGCCLGVFRTLSPPGPQAWWAVGLSLPAQDALAITE